MAKSKSKGKGASKGLNQAHVIQDSSAGNINTEMFEVVDIIDQVIDSDSQVWFHVRWKGSDESTWEPQINLAGCFNALAAWDAASSRKPRKRASSSSSSKQVSKKLRTAAPILDRIEELTSGTVTASAPVHIECAPTTNDKGHLLIPPTPTHPDTIKFQEKLDNLKGPPVTLVNSVGDNEHSPPLDFELIDNLVLGEGVPSFDAAFQCGCQCPPTGCTDTKECNCLDDIDPRQFAYKNGRIRPGRGNQISIVECNDSCSCSMECENRVVQRGRQIPIQIFRTSKKGWGLRCPQQLEPGTFVELYLGEVIGPEEASIRAEAGDEKGASYLFDLDKFDDDGPEEATYTIDGEQRGSIARFINHSCEPNLYTYAVMSDRRDGLVYNLALFTNRRIKAFEELTFAYVDVEAEKDEDPGDEKIDPKWKCMCGAKKCRGWLWRH